MVSKRLAQKLKEFSAPILLFIVLSNIVLFLIPTVNAGRCENRGFSSVCIDGRVTCPSGCLITGDPCTCPFGGVPTIIAPGTATAAILSTICGIYNLVTVVIGVLALAMFVLGGLLYGFAHFMPTAGNLRAGMQGWGIGLIIGAIIAAVIFILAPFVINTIFAGNPTVQSALTTAGFGSTINEACQAFPAI